MPGPFKLAPRPLPDGCGAFDGLLGQLKRPDVWSLTRQRPLRHPVGGVVVAVVRGKGWGVVPPTSTTGRTGSGR